MQFQVGRLRELNSRRREWRGPTSEREPASHREALLLETRFVETRRRKLGVQLWQGCDASRSLHLGAPKANARERLQRATKHLVKKGRRLCALRGAPGTLRKWVEMKGEAILPRYFLLVESIFLFFLCPQMRAARFPCFLSHFAAPATAHTFAAHPAPVTQKERTRGVFDGAEEDEAVHGRLSRDHA